MDRSFFLEHLADQGCFADGDGGTEAGEFYSNCVNGEVCNVPHDEYLESATWCHIVWELKIDPPIGYDSDYDVYSGFRQKLLNEINQAP